MGHERVGWVLNEGVGCGGCFMKGYGGGRVGHEIHRVGWNGSCTCRVSSLLLFLTFSHF